jgi:hypothetical protein
MFAHHKSYRRSARGPRAEIYAGRPAPTRVWSCAARDRSGI